MKSKSECSCEPNMREFCMHCDHEKKHKGREQRILYDRIPAQFVESVPGSKQAESKICTELKTGETLFRTGDRIISQEKENKVGKEIVCSTLEIRPPSWSVEQAKRTDRKTTQ